MPIAVGAQIRKLSSSLIVFLHHSRNHPAQLLTSFTPTTQLVAQSHQLAGAAQYAGVGAALAGHFSPSLYLASPLFKHSREHHQPALSFPYFVDVPHCIHPSGHG